MEPTITLSEYTALQARTDKIESMMLACALDYNKALVIIGDLEQQLAAASKPFRPPLADRVYVTCVREPMGHGVLSYADLSRMQGQIANLMGLAKRVAELERANDVLQAEIEELWTANPVIKSRYER